MKEPYPLDELACDAFPVACEWTPGIIDFAQNYGPLIGVGAAGAGAGVGAFLAWRRFLRNEYHGEITISLNTIDEEAREKYLRLYTLREQKVTQALPDNRSLLKRVYKAAGQATEDDVFLFLPENARYVVMPAVINGISELNAGGKMARENGLPTVKHTYLVGITWEPYGAALSHKFRVMVISEQTLMDYFAPRKLRERNGLRVKNPHHIDRFRTLEQMACIRMKEEKDGVPINDRRIREVDWHQPVLTTDCGNCGAEVHFARAA